MARPTNEELARRRAAMQAEAPGATVVEGVTDTGVEFMAPAVSNDALVLNEDIERIRALRAKQPFGAFDKKLDLPPIRGYKQHWFNDKPGRIERAMSAGWTHVLDETGKPKTLIADSGGLRAYALKIPEEFWAEDVKRSEAKAKAALDAVKKKPSQSGQPIAAKDQGAFYTPHASGDAAEMTREKR